jgi:small-conductance mechanosensitive channel
MSLLEPLIAWGTPALITLMAFAVLIRVIARSFPRTPSAAIYRQLAIVTAVLLGMIVLVVALPLSDELTGQMISLFGLVITAVIALASTTFVGNLIAGLMLRGIASFGHGDFIWIGEHFGRVTDKGLLQTEIQSEDRDLIVLPNLFVMTQPVRIVRSSGTLISTELSLGYDQQRTRVAELLKEAAAACELEEPFVQITELGNFAVTYRVSGFLGNIGHMVTKRSQLNGRVLDVLHGAGIEIVSPSFMNQRPVAPDVRILPIGRGVTPPADDGAVERIMFDKADVVARIDALSEQRHQVVTEIEKLADAHGPHAEHELTWRRQHLESLDALIQSLKQGID